MLSADGGWQVVARLGHTLKVWAQGTRSTRGGLPALSPAPKRQLARRYSLSPPSAAICGSAASLGMFTLVRLLSSSAKSSSVLMRSLSDSSS